MVTDFLPASTPINPVQLAMIGGAHGVRGEVRVKSFTSDPEALGEYGTLYAEDGRQFAVLSARPQKDMLVVRFKGVEDRSAAEALNGVALFVDRSALPNDLEDDEFYHADLIGMKAVDPDGVTLGSVIAVHNHGGGDLLELRPVSSGGTIYLPFTVAAVPNVDLGARLVLVDPVAAGLSDEPAGHEEREG